MDIWGYSCHTTSSCAGLSRAQLSPAQALAPRDTLAQPCHATRDDAGKAKHLLSTWDGGPSAPNLPSYTWAPTLTLLQGLGEGIHMALGLQHRGAGSERGFSPVLVAK